MTIDEKLDEIIKTLADLNDDIKALKKQVKKVDDDNEKSKFYKQKDKESR